MELNDGTVIPSYLGNSLAQNHSSVNTTYNNITLRIGRIVGIHNPNEDSNYNKKVIEYDVETTYSDMNGGYAPIVFPRVRVESMFGGVADYIRWTPRMENFNKQTGKGLGSKVLILCVNGNTRDAYIVGGIPDNQSKIVEEEGLHYIFEFNGTNLTINDDGEFTILHNGATNADGSIIDSKGSKSSIIFSKDGNITLGYQNDTSFPFMVLDKSNKKVTITANSNIVANTGSGFIINDGGILPQAFLKATLYRQQESLLHQLLQSSLATLTTLAATAGSSLATAAPLVTAASVPLAAAATAIIAMAPQFTAMNSAIAAFEALSQQYLSNKHKFSEDPI